MSDVTGPVTLRNHRLSPVAAWLTIAVLIISSFEGFSSRAYKDSIGETTICYGATRYDRVDLTKTYTKQQCQTMLATDIPKYDAPLQQCLTPQVYNALPPHRHAALVSLAYNVGDAAVCHSSIVRNLNLGHIQQACDDFLLFDRAGGRVLAGLVNRRRAERVLCLRND